VGGSQCAEGVVRLCFAMVIRVTSSGPDAELGTTDDIEA
jgi:hypothetical protein